MKYIKKHPWYQWLIFLASVFLNAFIVFQSCLPASPSSNWSNWFTNFLSGIINATFDADPPYINANNLELTLYDGYSYNLVEGFAPNEIPIGATKALYAKVLPDDSTVKTVTFSCDNENVKLVPSGNVCYVENHTTNEDFIVKCRTNDSDIEKEFKFKAVDLKAPYKFDIIQNELNVYSGLSIPIPISIRSEILKDEELLLCRYYDNSRLAYSCDNNEILTIDKYGVIHAKNEGNAVVSVSNGEITKLLNVHVDKNENEITYPTNGMSITGGDTCYVSDLDYDRESSDGGSHHLPLSVSFNGVEPSDKSVTWLSSNELIAKVDKNGNVRGFRNIGDVEITAISNMDNTIKATKIIHVEKVLPKSIECIDNFSVDKNKSEGFSVNLLPINVTDGGVIVETGDGNIATVSSSGNYITIYGVNAGETTITIKAKSNPSVCKTVKITINRNLPINEDNIQEFSMSVRKFIGHFSLFFVSGILTTLSFYFFIGLKNKKLLLTLAISSGVGLTLAGLTEIIQHFVEGRFGDIKDVGIDFAGYLIATLIVCGIIALYLRRKKKKIKEDNGNEIAD